MFSLSAALLFESHTLNSCIDVIYSFEFDSVKAGGVRKIAVPLYVTEFFMCKPKKQSSAVRHVRDAVDRRTREHAVDRRTRRPASAS